MNQITLNAHAKVNLTLEVLRRLPSGYHEIVSIMQELELHDKLTIQNRPDDQVEIRCDCPDVPLDERNLVWKAVDLIRRKTGSNRGATITISKNIPIAGGMAGGSSNAAATLRALNEIWCLGMTDDNLLEIGTEIGMDVPFLLVGGTALATGRGEEIHPLPPLPSFYVVVANPGLGISTKEAFENLNWSRLSANCVTPSMTFAILNGDDRHAITMLHNDFEINVSDNMPQIPQIKSIMLSNGALSASLSGTGSSVYCFSDAIEQAELIVESLKSVVPFVALTKTKIRPHQTINIKYSDLKTIHR